MLKVLINNQWQDVMYSKDTFLLNKFALKLEHKGYKVKVEL
jgi:hypothetical protein